LVTGAGLQAVFDMKNNYLVEVKKNFQALGEMRQRMLSTNTLLMAQEDMFRKTGASAAVTAKDIGKMAASIGVMATAAYAARKGLDAMFASINTAAMQKMQETTFGALLGDFQAGSAVYSYISAYARDSMLGREELSKGMTTFLTFSRDMSELQRMLQMTERLYAKDPTQGAEGAVFALKELLTGSKESIQDRFGISGFNMESIRSKMNTGNITGALDEIDAIMTKFGASQAVVEANFYSMTSQMNMFKTNLKSALGEEAVPLMEHFGAMWARLNEDLAAGKFQPAIDSMIRGFNAVGTIAIWAADNINWLIPTVGGVVTAVSAYNTVMAISPIITKIATAAQQKYNITLGTTAALSTAALGPYAMLAAAVLGIAAAFGLAGKGASNLNNSLANVPSLEEAYKRAAEALAKRPDITSSAPTLEVTGTVGIKDESLKYMMDFAGMRYFASYSHVVPQMVMNNPQISQEADWEKGFELFTNFIAKDYSGQPAGMGAGV